MPKAENGECAAHDLVSHFIMAHDDSPDLTRFESLQLFAKARIVEQAVRRMRKLLHDTRGRLRCDRPQMLIQAQNVRRRLTGPLNLPPVGEGSGLSVERLSAHA